MCIGKYHVQQVQYESIDFCFLCGILGHTPKQCKNKSNIQNTTHIEEAVKPQETTQNLLKHGELENTTPL